MNSDREFVDFEYPRPFLSICAACVFVMFGILLGSTNAWTKLKTAIFQWSSGSQPTARRNRRETLNKDTDDSKDESSEQTTLKKKENQKKKKKRKAENEKEDAEECEHLNVYSSSLFFQNIPDQISENELKNYLKRVTDSVPLLLRFADDDKGVVVTFDRNQGLYGVK
jgi:hypothetical protein